MYTCMYLFFIKFTEAHPWSQPYSVVLTNSRAVVCLYRSVWTERQNSNQSGQASWESCWKHYIDEGETGIHAQAMYGMGGE